MSSARLSVFLARPSVQGARALLLASRERGEPPAPDALRWLLSADHWDTLSPPLQELCAQGVETLLPSGFALTGLAPWALGAQQHVAAHFSRGTDAFALVPGGTLRLGWDRRDVALTSLQRAAWTQANDDPAVVRFEQVLDLYLTPSRQVTLDPFLLEVTAREARPFVDDELDRGAPEDESPLVLLERAVAREGFRLPTSDEWEHACRGGSPALFRWGEEWPRGVPQNGATDFTAHQAPNGYGLQLPDDPRVVECVAGGAVFRGGDGGGAVDSGRPQPEPWYSFASAFAYPADGEGEDLDELFDTARVRRALSLFEPPSGGTP